MIYDMYRMAEAFVASGGGLGGRGDSLTAEQKRMALLVENHAEKTSIRDTILASGKSETKEPSAEETGKTKGVIRNIKAGNFKGVADIRLRINFHEELAADRSQEVARQIEEEAEILDVEDFSDGKAVMHLSELNVPRRKARQLVGFFRRMSRGLKVCQIITGMQSSAASLA